MELYGSDSQNYIKNTYIYVSKCLLYKSGENASAYFDTTVVNSTKFFNENREEETHISPEIRNVVSQNW